MANRPYQYLTTLHADLASLGVPELDAPDLLVVEPGTIHPPHVRLDVSVNLVFGGDSSHVSQHFFPAWEDACKGVLRREGELIDEAGNIHRLKAVTIALSKPYYELDLRILDLWTVELDWLLDGQGTAYNRCRTMYLRVLNWSRK